MAFIQHYDTITVHVNLTFYHDTLKFFEYLIYRHPVSIWRSSPWGWSSSWKVRCTCRWSASPFLFALAPSPTHLRTSTSSHWHWYMSELSIFGTVTDQTIIQHVEILQWIQNQYLFILLKYLYQWGLIINNMHDLRVPCSPLVGVAYWWMATPPNIIRTGP